MPLDTLTSEIDANPAPPDIIPYAVPETTPTPLDMASYTVKGSLGKMNLLRSYLNCTFYEERKKRK